MSEIFTMGEPMVVFIAEKPGTFSEVENYSRGLAGAELNFSIGVTRLGHTASYFTSLEKTLTELISMNLSKRKRLTEKRFFLQKSILPDRI